MMCECVVFLIAPDVSSVKLPSLLLFVELSGSEKRGGGEERERGRGTS